MTDIDGMKLFSWAMKLSPAVIGMYLVFNLYKKYWADKRQITSILFQMAISAALGFAVFFAAAWLWLRLKQGSVPEALIPCIISGIIGFYIGMLSNFLISKKNNETTKQKRGSTQQPNRGDGE